MREHAFAQFNLGPATGDVHNTARDRIAHLVLGDVLVNAGWLELLDPEPEAPPLAVRLQYLSSNSLAHLERFVGMIEALLAADVADVDHALDPVAHIDE